MFPKAGIVQEQFELEESLGTKAVPASALAFESAVDFNLDILFHRATAAFDRCRSASNRAAQAGRQCFPRIDTFAAAQDVTEELSKFFWPAEPKRTGAQGFEHRLALGAPDRLQEAVIFALVIRDEGPDSLCDMPAIQQPGGLREVLLPEPAQPFLSVAEDEVVLGLEAAQCFALHLAAEQSQRFGGGQEYFIL